MLTVILITAGISLATGGIAGWQLTSRARAADIAEAESRADVAEAQAATVAHTGEAVRAAVAEGYTSALTEQGLTDASRAAVFCDPGDRYDKTACLLVQCWQQGIAEHGKAEASQCDVWNNLAATQTVWDLCSPLATEPEDLREECFNLAEKRK